MEQKIPTVLHLLTRHLDTLTLEPSCRMPVTNSSQKMTNSSLGIQLGHLLQIDANTFAIKQYKVNVLQGGVGGGHKMVGDGLQGELSRHLLWESVSVREIHEVKCGSDS